MTNELFIRYHLTDNTIEWKESSFEEIMKNKSHISKKSNKKFTRLQPESQI